MKIGVYSLQKVLFQGDAKSVNCVTTGGEITILENHEPFISLLGRGVMVVTDAAGKEHGIPVKSGFLEVRAGNEARFLVGEDKNE